MTAQRLYRWFLAGFVAAVLTATAGGLAGYLARDPQFSWVHALVYGAMLAPSLVALMWLLLVVPVAPKDGPARSADTVEHAWFGRAAEGAFIDLMVLAGLLLAVTSFADVPLGARAVAGVVLVTGWLDLALRYRLLSRREA